jgi:DNA (cytosine-5)-methyltransferase 1
MKILNLYAGIGGNRKLWGNEHDITAIEFKEDIAAEYKKNFPEDKVIVTDAHQYLLEHYKEFDFIWSSPPCPTHSRLCYAKQGNKEYPEMSLYQEIIFLKHFFKGKWVVENVKPYYKVLIEPNVEIDRHLFWSNFEITAINIKPLNFYKVGTTNQKMAEYHGLPYPNCNDNRKVLRNCVNPLVGKHIFDCVCVLC